MSEPLVITVEGKPIAWQRATPVVAGDYVIPKTPKETRAYQALIKAIAELAMRGREKFTGALRMTVTATIRRPETAVKEGRRFPYKQGTGDIDNYSKTAQDALNGLAFVDDSQICDLVVFKRYGRPALVIMLEELEDAEPEGKC